MLTAEMKQMLLDHSPAYVATVCPDGTPNLSPKGTVMAWDDLRIVFLDLHSPQTVANLRASFFQQHRSIDPRRVHAVIVMDVAQTRPLISPAYDDGSSEQQIRARWIARFSSLIERVCT